MTNEQHEAWVGMVSLAKREMITSGHLIIAANEEIETLKAQLARLSSALNRILKEARSEWAINEIAGELKLHEALADPSVASAQQWLAEQLQTARTAGMEEAAEICDRLTREHFERGNVAYKDGTPPHTIVDSEYVIELVKQRRTEACADSIRAAAIRKPEVTR